MAKTVKVKMNLAVDVENKSMAAYSGIRDTDAESVKMQAVQDYLYDALHGWGGSTQMAAYLALEDGVAFQPTLDAAGETGLPVWAELGAAVKGGLEAYNALGFGLEFGLSDKDHPATCVKLVRKGDKEVLVYNFDLTVTVGVQDETQCNILPIVASLAVPPVLQDFKDAGIKAHYQMLLEVERTVSAK